jgi:hypothetical protein
MKFLNEEFNLVQIVKIIGGIVVVILLWIIHKDIIHLTTSLHKIYY